jgi:hypothetical protein
MFRQTLQRQFLALLWVALALAETTLTILETQALSV